MSIQNTALFAVRNDLRGQRPDKSGLLIARTGGCARDRPAHPTSKEVTGAESVTLTVGQMPPTATPQCTTTTPIFRPRGIWQRTVRAYREYSNGAPSATMNPAAMGTLARSRTRTSGYWY